LRAPSGDPIVAEVANALAGLRTANPDDDDALAGTPGELAAMSPLGVARLRGGVRLDLSWRLDPAQCQVICATPQMWGSRLLLRGFRASRRARNLEAGLLGHDAVVVIDEAHLHERLVETTARVAVDSGSPLALQAVAMSATRSADEALRLSAEDLDDQRLSRRVRAAKRVSVVAVSDWRREAVTVLAEQARRLHATGTVGVFVNTVEAALSVADRLEGTVAVVCGRMRPADLDEMRARWPGLLGPEGNDEVDYLVSTQSLEVGVDLDLPMVVTAIAPPNALAQRAGRLNRSGKRGESELVVVAPAGLDAADPADLDNLFAPYSGEQIIAGARWLAALDGDASPERIGEVSLALEQDVRSGLPLPPLTRVELETLAMSSSTLAADVDPSFYVAEPQTRDDRRVALCARRHLDIVGRAEAADVGGAIVARMLEAAPPRAHELATVSIARGRWISDILARVEAWWVVRFEGGQRVVERGEDPQQLRDGDVVVVPDGSPICVRGVIGLPRRGLGSPFNDVIDRRQEGRPDTVTAMRAEAMREALELDRTLASRAARDLVAKALAEVGEAGLAAELRRNRLRDLELTWCGDDAASDGLLVVVATGREGRLPTGAVADQAITVDAHCEAVEDRLAAIIDALDLDEQQEALGATRQQLLDAARWHDLGKRHPRFQRRMGADPNGPPLAKPAPGHRPDRDDYDGWRHEQLSAAYAWRRSGGDALTTALVAAHHGHGLPLFDRGPDAVRSGWEDCEPDIVDALHELFGEYGRYELERARLGRQLGVHRLAYLEALLRCGDMQISREGR
jgi:CRISPR-associated endonuclease/helicase Cas3